MSKPTPLESIANTIEIYGDNVTSSEALDLSKQIRSIYRIECIEEVLKILRESRVISAGGTVYEQIKELARYE